MTRGRKTLYDPAFCDQVKAFHTLTAFARHIGVVLFTVYRWTRKYPEFAEAIEGMARPTLYRAEYCDDVVECLKDGHSLAVFAGKIDVTRKSIYDWMAKHPEFADAVRRAQARSALWWERRLLDLAQNNQGKAGAVILALKNRVAAEWRETHHTEMRGTVERVHRIERVVVRPERSDG